MAVSQSTPADPVKSGTVTTQRPVRTCIGCRQRAVASELLRIVVVPHAGGEAHNASLVVADERRRLPGRGAWLHPVQACVELAERRRAFARSLRVSAAINAAPIAEYVAQLHHDQHGQ